MSNTSKNLLQAEPGQWLRNKYNREHTTKCLYGSKHIDANIWEIWEPEFDELCIFFNADPKGVRISRFRQIGYGKNKEGFYKDNQGNYFQNCIPFNASSYETISWLLNKSIKNVDL